MEYYSMVIYEILILLKTHFLLLGLLQILITYQEVSEF